ncbi:4Fe-4S single cluster domain-containing protein [Paenarthrobacter sp. YJN-5]|uniref:4Fe-4S single cluster domain-containing protein n=1 Tax=Paenarthrobacter sp. YJN-5 TaxID=2735316 RepID=UPI0021033D8A|nr:4Fe-4S single cluster domain-containing protein [Paenarthrobacter sp. YJN-5]
MRTAIWFQGCSIRCKGCINPHLFSPRGGTQLPVAGIIDDAVAAGVEGLTLIGGEPFDQPDAGCSLATAARAAGLGVIAFSGYEYEALRERDDSTRAFLAKVDLLVDGPYQDWNPETDRALVGSGNQRFIHLTDRYKDYRPELARNRVDIRVRPDGTIEVAGFLDSAALDDLGRLTSSTRTLRGV